MYLVISGGADSYLLLITLWQLSLYSLGIVVRSNLKSTLMINNNLLNQYKINFCTQRINLFSKIIFSGRFPNEPVPINYLLLGIVFDKSLFVQFIFLSSIGNLY